MTVIEEHVLRSSVRTAKQTFWIVAAVVGLLAAAVAAERTHPIVALLIGALIGTGVAAVVAAVVFAWPVLRVIWWWLPELLVAGSLVLAWVQVAEHTTLWARLAVTLALVGVIAGIPHVRRIALACGWCLVSRHRLRTCFAQFIITNRTGSLPLLLWTRPTPVGERLWVWLRPGLSLTDLEGRLEKIAAACWAGTVTVERASLRNSALVRMDIKRRDAWTDVNTPPLLELVPDLPADDTADDAAAAPTALDLPEVTARTAAQDRTEQRTTKPAPAHAAAASTSTGDDLSDWL